MDPFPKTASVKNAVFSLKLPMSEKKDKEFLSLVSEGIVLGADSFMKTAFDICLENKQILSFPHGTKMAGGEIEKALIEMSHDYLPIAIDAFYVRTGK